MATPLRGGIAGWIAGALPLVVVNVADYFGVFAFHDALVAGAAALVAGALLCGIVAGSIGGRASAGQPGGAAAAAPGGIVAALLFVTSVAILLVGTGIRDAAFTFDVRQWLGLTAGLLFFAVLPIGVALVAGGLAGRRARQRSALPSMPNRQGPMPAQRSGPYSAPQTWGDLRNQTPREDWRNSADWDSLPPPAHGANREAPRAGPPGQYAPPGRSGRQPGDASHR